VTWYLGYWLIVSGLHWNLFIVFTGSIADGVVGLILMDKMRDWLTRRRFTSWAEEVHGVHPDDFDDFLAKTSPEDLEKMVAHDFEGLIEDEDDEAFLAKLDEGL
jgi:hypothetical protein